MNHFIEVFENALSSEDCKYIINYMNNECVLKPGVMPVSRFPKKNEVWKERKDDFEKLMNIEGRRSEDLGLTADDDQTNTIIRLNLIKCIDKYIDIHPQLLEIEGWNYYELYNLQKYEPGQGFHMMHCEHSHSKSTRIMAWMFYLNTVTDGGGTYFQNYDLTMNAVEGRCVIWPAYWTYFHKGIVSKTETKYIETGWINFIDSV